MYPREARAQGWTYPPDPAELRTIDASAVLLTPSWALPSHSHAEPKRDDDTPKDEDLRRVIEGAHEAGLSVALMPFLRVHGSWRGALSPKAPRRFWQAYEAFLSHYAGFPGVHTFAVGTEMSSLSTAAYRASWQGLCARLRAQTDARLAYVANHDALHLDAPFPFVDTLGVSAYFPVDTGWHAHARTLKRFRERTQKPLVIFELGFPSRRGALFTPWDDVSGTPFSEEEQARGLRLATDALVDADWLDGTFFWNWYGDGNRFDRSYALQGKEAEAIARRFLRARSNPIVRSTK